MTEGPPRATQLPGTDGGGERSAARGAGDRERHRLALALGGGAACGLAHIGVLDVLEREGIAVDCVAGCSMGGLIGALHAAGMRAREIERAARHFHFPGWYFFGVMLRWDTVFPSAVPILDGLTFETLSTPLLIPAVDLQSGAQVVLQHGPVLPAVRATCAVPGVLAPVDVRGRWLVDGGVVNVLPVDVAWMADPDVVMAVNVGGPQSRRLPALDWPLGSALSWLARFVPTPISAKLAFDILVRASEIALAHQTTLATAMTGPEVVVQPRLGDMGFRDFARLDEAVAAGRRAAEEALSDLVRALEAPPARDGAKRTIHFDPVCGMALSAVRARAQAELDGATYYFCSANCRDSFVRSPERFAIVRATATREPS